MQINANTRSSKGKKERKNSIELNKTINLPCGGQDFSNTDDVVYGLACKYMRVVIEYCKHSSKIEEEWLGVK